jgi:hypothetical protein
LSGTVRNIAIECPNATVKDGLSITGSQAGSAKMNVGNWLKKNL